MDILTQSIYKYRSISVSNFMAFTNNVVIHDTPGTGKTIVSKVDNFVTISHGLWVLPTSLLASHNTSLEDNHIHAQLVWNQEELIWSPFLYK